ncbi:hemagglutinin repeat-containing protein [Serratia marcescens]|uniref:Hemagglutinin repeat-containing protein n=1 Tax=Serratia marcescens TaxID=615 RepID=A0A939NQD1_SERMA|nr:hemagglutinin repeat-containing protein [Serratia marcescens]
MAGNRLLAEVCRLTARGAGYVSAQDVTIRRAYPHARPDSENKREGKTKSHRIEQTEREISTGSTFSARDGVTVVGREGDVTVTGSTCTANRCHALQAKKDVTLNHTTDREHRVSSERAAAGKPRGSAPKKSCGEMWWAAPQWAGAVSVVAQTVASPPRLAPCTANRRCCPAGETG